jgi:hypothetical protein
MNISLAYALETEKIIANLPYIPEPITPVSKEDKRSVHYLSFVRSLPCIGCQLSGEKQTSDTTAHHVYTGGMALKCPDFFTVPVEYVRHVTGPKSIATLGKVDWLKYHKADSWEILTLLVLKRYLYNATYVRPIYVEDEDRVVIDPKDTDGSFAVYYLNELIQKTKEIHGQ